jgi:hypothetical protein
MYLFAYVPEYIPRINTRLFAILIAKISMYYVCSYVPSLPKYLRTYKDNYSHCELFDEYNEVATFIATLCIPPHCHSADLAPLWTSYTQPTTLK